MSNIVNELEAVGKAIEAAQEYNLVPEVVLFALLAMKKDPNLSIEEALTFGVCEWVK